MVKIVLDAVEKEVVSNDYLLIKKLAHHLNISTGDVSLLRRDDSELLGESLISGPGNVFSLDAGKGTALSWGVGCGKVRAKHVKYLESLGELAKNGTLAKILGRNIRGWSVNNVKVVKSKRRRREIRHNNKNGNIVSSKNNEEIEGSGPEWPTTSPSIITTSGSASTHKCRHHHCDHTRKTTLGTTVSVEDIDLIRPTAVVTEEEMSSSVVLESVAPISTEKPSSTTQKTTTPFNNNPVLGPDFNKFDLPYAMPGKVFRYLIPENAFSDIEEGTTRNLQLVLKSADHWEIDPIHWLQLDEENQTLWGMPTEDDHAKIGYILSAVDKGGKVAHATFFVNIEKAPREEYTTHEFSIVIDYNFEDFRLGGSRNRVELAEKISKYLHPKERENTVRMLQIRRGSVLFTWRDSSIDGSIAEMSKRTSCPVRRIKRNILKMVDCEPGMINCVVRKDFLRAMRPWDIKLFSFQAVGKCSLGYDLKPLEVAVVKDKIEKTKPPRPAATETTLTIIIASSLIAFVLLFGAIVACILYRAKRKGKMSVTDKQTFVSKGIPVIFADELDDNPQSVTKPLILANEKPPETDPDQGRYMRPSTFSSGTSSFGQRPSPPAPSRQPPPYVPP
ncbi:unnamed protein product [Dimorphilus gyrociliatus]|nr:unnamed protein product [Dimorphilus gyrociliatus]